MPGKPRRRAVLDAAREVAMPIFVSTITTIVVFLPTVFLEGQAQAPLHPADLHHLLLALRLLPRLADGHPAALPALARAGAAADRRAAQPVHAGARAGAGACSSGSTRSTSASLGWALGHRKTLIGGILALAATAVALLPLIGTEFFPPSDESQFIIRVRAPVGTRVEETERIVGPDGGASSGPTLKPERVHVDRLHGGRADRPLGRLLPEHRAPRGPAPGLPERPRQADAQRPGDRRGDPAEVRRPVPGHDHTRSSSAAS